MENIAPNIFRQRLIIEGYYTIDVTKNIVEDYLLGMASHLELRTYGDPIVFSPASGMGKEENAGFDAFVPLIDSGISVYIWCNAKFFSTVLYTCKGFDPQAAVDFSAGFFKTTDPVVHASF